MSDREKKFTPGPWRCNPNQEQMVLATPPKGWKTTPENPNYIVAQASIYTSPEQLVALYNANLIAAAPELLEALEACEYLISKLLDKDVMTKTTAGVLTSSAIKKAYGESK